MQRRVVLQGSALEIRQEHALQQLLALVVAVAQQDIEVLERLAAELLGLVDDDDNAELDGSRLAKRRTRHLPALEVEFLDDRGLEVWPVAARVADQDTARVFVEELGQRAREARLSDPLPAANADPRRAVLEPALDLGVGLPQRLCCKHEALAARPLEGRALELVELQVRRHVANSSAVLANRLSGSGLIAAGTRIGCRRAARWRRAVSIRPLNSGSARARLKPGPC